MKLQTRQRLTYVAWGLAAAGSMVLWGRNTPVRGSIPGIVESDRHALGAAAAGRVAGVFVRPGDLVRAGDAVAQLSTDAVDAELAVAHKIYDELLADLDALTAEAQQQVRTQRQSLAAELARTRAALAAARSDEAATRAEASSLKEQIGRLDAVVQDRLAQADKVGELRAREYALAESSRHAPEVVQAWKGLAAGVNAALDGITDEVVAARVRPLKARLETQTARIGNLIEARNRLTLRAPVDGQVALVLRASGDAVGAGEAVVQLVGRRAARVVAYAPEEVARAFAPGRSIVASPRERGVQVSGTITAVGAEVVEMPTHLRIVPDRPRFGRPVYIQLGAAPEEAEALLAGEALQVAAREGTGGAVAAVKTDVGPPELVVPDALRKATRLEGSGFVWVPEWQRFLVVSDDTGPVGVDVSPPWLFTLDAAKGFDAEPLRIEGLETFSDLESVTRAADGTFYLLASQSLSAKGRRPEKRQLLVHAALEPGRQGLRALESVPLHDTLTSHLDAAARQAIGFTVLLDIEGMTAVPGGLLLGLKAPQDEAGRARLLKLTLGAGERSLTELSVEPFRAVPLPTCATQAPGGVSDLYADGDTLYMTSTLPEGPPCGSAWRLDLRSAASIPVKLEDFPGFKPEGITRDAQGRLVVLFDTGEDAPRMATLTESKP